MTPQKDQLLAWLEPGEKGPQKAMQKRYGDKRMLLLAMDYYGVAFYHLCGEKETINAELLKSILNEKIPIWLSTKKFSKSMI